MYLANEAKQVDGYPAFRDPGVISGYYVSSYIPTVEILSYSKVTQVIQSTGATDLAMAGTALAALVATLSFWFVEWIWNTEVKIENKSIKKVNNMRTTNSSKNKAFLCF